MAFVKKMFKHKDKSGLWLIYKLDKQRASIILWLLSVAEVNGDTSDDLAAQTAGLSIKDDSEEVATFALS